MNNDKSRFSLGTAKSAGNLYWKKVFLCCLVLTLWLAPACRYKAPPPPPAPVYPTRVITQDGVAFMIHRFRIPGTRQEITLRYDATKQWMALNLLQRVQFSGPVKEGYRQAEITLSSGERMQAEIFVNTVVEGESDLGYWNMSLSRIDRLDLGSD
jgi:hypothetical protein